MEILKKLKEKVKGKPKSDEANDEANDEQAIDDIITKSEQNRKTRENEEKQSRKSDLKRNPSAQAILPMDYYERAKKFDQRDPTLLEVYRQELRYNKDFFMQKAFEYYKVAADTGIPEAQHEVGKCFENGIGVTKNEGAALRYYQLASSHEHGVYDLAYSDLTRLTQEMYSKQNPQVEKTSTPLSSAALQESYEKERKHSAAPTPPSPPPDDLNTEKENFELDKLAAEQGNAEAMWKVANYLQMNGYAASRGQEIFQYYQSAAEGGYLQGRADLANCFEQGIGVTRDHKEALRHYKLAAEEGNQDAQFTLGQKYERGHQVDKDINEAFRYYKLAADQGHRAAITKVAMLERHKGKKDRASSSFSFSSTANSSSSTSSSSSSSSSSSPPPLPPRPRPPTRPPG